MTYTRIDFECMKSDPKLTRRYMRDCFLRWMANGIDGAKLIAELNEIPDEMLLDIANS